MNSTSEKPKAETYYLFFLTAQAQRMLRNIVYLLSAERAKSKKALIF
jgi:hypothetical protein